jgi:hypothetical protein
MVDPAILLHKHLLGEAPQNLVTALRSVEGDLDGRLGIVVDRQQTDYLLEQTQDLRSQLDALRTDLRLLPKSRDESPAAFHPPDAQSQAAREAPVDGEGSSSREDAAAASVSESEDRRLQLTREIAETEQQLQSVSDSYRRAIEAEDRAADVLRHEARKRVSVEKEERVEQVETELLNLGENLSKAKRALNDLLEEKQQFLRRHLIIRPSLIALIVFGVPLLAAVGEIEPARNLVLLFWLNLSQFLTGLIIIVLVYVAVVFWKFARDLNQRLKHEQEHVKLLSSQLSATAVQLRRAHNDQLLFKYEIFAHQMRVDTSTHSIETASQRSHDLSDKLAALREISDSFARTRVEAEPAASVMRRPLLQAKDIDSYYQKTVTKLEVYVGDFTRDHVRRSQVRGISPEEFRTKLLAFTLGQFNHLADLSIEDALLRQRDLVPPETANTRMRELNDAAQPLLRLRQTDATGTGMFAQQDATLWASGEESERLHDLYRRVCPGVNVRPGNDDRSLCVLTRSLSFPAYFIGAIEFYRDCYERETNTKDAADLPDVLPTNDRVNRAHERFLLALAVGLVTRRPGGEYVFANGSGESFGSDRKQIAERLATNFASQKLYAEFETNLNGRLATEESVYQKLIEFLDSTHDITSSEREMLGALMRKYF